MYSKRLGTNCIEEGFKDGLMRKMILLASLLAVLGGCQTTRPIVKPEALDNSAFMNLWSTYSHCRLSLDVDAMRADVQRLNQVALAPPPRRHFPIPLPNTIKRLIAHPNPRLAVDPKAMAAACSLHAGQVAQQAGLEQLATDLYHAVVLDYPQSKYAYYVSKAGVGLEQLRLGIPYVLPISSLPAGPQGEFSLLSAY